MVEKPEKIERKVFKCETCPVSVTKTIDACDEQNWLILTTGYLQDERTIRLAAPHSPKTLRLPRSMSFSSREEMAAWVLSARFRRAVYFDEFGRFGTNRSDFRLERAEVKSQRALEVPCGTWILGHPKSTSSAFGSWFKRNPDHVRDYRIMIYYNPREFGDRKLEPIWETVYQSSPRIIHERKHLLPEQKRVAKEFLASLLAAYQHGGGIAEELIKGTGHEFGFSEGKTTL